MSDVPSWAAQYVGLPFLRCGRTRAGLDCWGLVALVLSEQWGLRLPDYGGIGWGAGPVEDVAAVMAREAASRWREIPATAVQAGDVALMLAGGLPIHVGVAVSRVWMLHTEVAADCCLERLDSAQSRRRIVGFYRYDTSSEHGRACPAADVPPPL